MHRDAAIREAQIQRRGALLNTGQTARLATEIPDEIVIQILLTLLHHPGAKAAEVVRYLRGHSPPISFEQVDTVFARYDLESIGRGQLEILSRLRGHARQAGWSAAEMARARVGRENPAASTPPSD